MPPTGCRWQLPDTHRRFTPDATTPSQAETPPDSDHIPTRHITNKPDSKFRPTLLDDRAADYEDENRGAGGDDDQGRDKERRS